MRVSLPGGIWWHYAVDKGDRTACGMWIETYEQRDGRRITVEPVRSKAVPSGGKACWFCDERLTRSALP